MHSENWTESSSATYSQDALNATLLDNTGEATQSYRTQASRKSYHPASRVAASGILAATMLSSSVVLRDNDLASTAFVDYFNNLDNTTLFPNQQHFDMPGESFTPFAPRRVIRTNSLITGVKHVSPKFRG